MATPNEGECIVVTGANRGIGYQLSRALAEDGHRVAALDLSGENVRSLRAEGPGEVRYYDCDVTDDEAVDATVNGVLDEWGRIDILVNNAGIARPGLFREQSTADVRREFEVNFFGYRRLIRAVLPGMLERGAGIIHNVGSGTADTGHPGLSGYAATKGAIKALVRSLRLELRDTGVSCTLMVPPSTRTGMIADLDYPAWMTVSPEEVGRGLASEIHSTRAVVTPDRKTRLGLAVTRSVPALWRRLTADVVDGRGDDGDGPARNG